MCNLNILFFLFSQVQSKIENNQYVMERQAQFSALGEFAAGLAHDLNSPLSAVKMDIGTLKMYINSNKVSADDINEQRINAADSEMVGPIARSAKKKKTKVHVSVLCPGPVETNFNQVAGVEFAVKPQKSTYVAKYAIDQMFKGKMLIIPGIRMKLAKFFGRFLSDKALLRITYNIQKRKASH